jgi:hypothetical protein
VLALWTRTQPSPGATGLLHLGFARPETDSVERFLDAAASGLYVTSSVRQALPRDCRVSATTVGVCESSDLGSLEVYLAVGAWIGISVGPGIDPAPRGSDTAGVREVIGSWPEVASPPIAPWVAGLEESDRETFVALREAGVRTDKEYVGVRRDLPERIRVRADRHRFRFQTKAISLNDPFVVARFLPPWGLTAPLSALGLSPRATNIFAIAQLRTVKDVLALGPFGLTELPNLGRGTIREFAERIHAYAAREVEVGLIRSPELVSLPSRTISNPKHPDEVLSAPPTLRAGLDAALANLKDRYAEALGLWLGVAGRPLILEEIGSRLGVTRERARQLRNRAFELVLVQWPWAEELPRRIDTLLCARQEPLYLDVIASEDNWFDGFQDSLPVLQRLIEQYVGGEITVWPLRGRSIATRCRAERWEDVVAEGVATIEREMQTVLTRTDARILLTGVAVDHGAPELASGLWEAIESRLHFVAQPDGEPRLVAIGRGARASVLAVLEESDRPLHISEIVDRLRLRGGGERDDEGARNTLRTAIRDCGGVLYGRSVYGLEKHLPGEAEMLDEVVADLETIMIGGIKGRQWHCSELADALAERRPDLAEEYDQYIVNILLSRSAIAKSLRRLVWVVASGDSLQDRLDVAAMCEAALLQAGRPLSKRELREAISRVRGLNRNFLPQPSDRVIRLSHGMWGLADRDVGVSGENQRLALDALAAVLESRQKGLHVSELFDAVRTIGFEPDPELDQWELLGLAQTDTRFRVGRGQLVGLADWEGLRRRSIGQALLDLQLRHPEAVPGDLLYEFTCELLERRISRASVASHAARLGFVFDSVNGLWSVYSREPEENAPTDESDED